MYDVLGTEVATLVNEVKQPGKYEVEFDGSQLASGVYFYRMEAADFVQARKLLLVK
ncbi:MAG: T9SS type A sorting domain-containing protein [Bacteroidetes bacterium]|nr:T9SS type A sorting domain-containing protein [Bacteroidota bacterium]MBU1677308.1 T9SS type A sorting domain-containing protein [Bacteroidota bacterium]